MVLANSSVLALDLPILALHVPAINLIPTVAAVVVTVAPPTGVQTLSVRTFEQVLIVAVVFLWTIVFIGHIGAVWEAVTKPFQKNTKTLVLAGELSLRVTHLLAISTTRGESSLSCCDNGCSWS